MLFKNKKRSPEEETDRVRARVRRIATPDLLSWADQAIFGLGRHLSEYQRHGSEADLEEARMAAHALKEVLDDLHRRIDTPSRLERI